MSMTLTYNEFRSAHKGVAQAEISQLWKMYKEGDYKVPEAEPEVEVIEPEVIEEPVVEEVVVEAPVVTPPPAPPAPPAPPEPPQEDKLQLCKDFNRAVNRFQKLGASMPEEEVTKYHARLKEIASKTIPNNYTCEPTDSWKIWFGPTSDCLLINTTRQLAFRVDRSWWQRHYQTTVYVDRELLNNNDLIESEAMRYAKKGRYIPRYPLVGVECKLPQSYHDIQLR